MSVNAFLRIGAADGESIQKGKEKWIEVQGWDWDVSAESSWTKGGGASVGKPVPGKMQFIHQYDAASTVILGFICTGKGFPKAELEMAKTTGKATPETYITMTMEGCFITKVSNSCGSDGVVMQKVEMVFKKVKIEYKPQNGKDGTLGAAKAFEWDIPAGTASPSS